MRRRSGQRSGALAPVALVPALALVLAGCGGGEQGVEVDGVPIVEEGALKTCTHLSYRPFQFNEGGEVVGFDVDLVDLVAEDLGLEQQIVDISFDTITSGAALDTGECDVAAAGMTITDARSENFDFSDPYFDARQALITTADSGITGVDDLAGGSVGVQNDTTGKDWAEAELADGTEIRSYDDLPLLLAAVETGEVDAGINDNGVLYDAANENDTFAVVADIETNEQYGIGVRKDNDALRERINEVLQAAREDGRYEEIYVKWFGVAPEGVGTDATVDEDEEASDESEAADESEASDASESADAPALSEDPES
ncbi:transporter substrate-binding domain-containing protein [Actinoalloteichus caeruleus]|uniref:transporter substrate-binding domain-containing protein n=1 Tax=Actinoalloteichus cyanogriseus TaxID=2893586 RepID=UPI000A62276D|nr:transporter substrate-binding domain-containing protein [Actinoalloteichus caeruleus]